MPLQDLLNQAVEVRPGDHLVALYAEEKEIEDYVTSFIHSALLRNERCLYITGTWILPPCFGGLIASQPVPVPPVNFSCSIKSDVYSKGGKFSLG